jgi:hypothetical protein
VISYERFRIIRVVLTLYRLKEIASTCGRLETVSKLRDFEILMNKDKWVRKHTSRSETRGYVYFILLYSALKQVFKMAAFGLYTESGPFRAPTEMGVPRLVGSNSDIARARLCVDVCVSLLKELQILFQKKCVSPCKHPS